MLLAELASFTYSFDLFFFEGWDSDDDSSQLHCLGFIPYLYVGVGFGAFCKHGRFHLMLVENEHSALSSSASDELALFFDEETALVESNLLSLFHNLVDGDQILHDGWYMQDILNLYLVAIFLEWDITDVTSQMSSVVSDLNVLGSIQLS